MPSPDRRVRSSPGRRCRVDGQTFVAGACGDVARAYAADDVRRALDRILQPGWSGDADLSAQSPGDFATERRYQLHSFLIDVVDRDFAYACLLLGLNQPVNDEGRANSAAPYDRDFSRMSHPVV
jgi:hypothetical protein